MVDLNRIPQTYEEAIEHLAEWQGDDSTDSITVYLIPDPEKRTVRFVEVSTVFSDDDEIRPFSMGASKEFPFRSSTILLSQRDWESVKNGQKALPTGWEVSKLNQVWPRG